MEGKLNVLSSLSCVKRKEGTSYGFLNLITTINVLVGYFVLSNIDEALGMMPIGGQAVRDTFKCANSYY